MDINIPTFPEGIKHAKIIALHIRQGEEIKENDLIAEMETDKAILEIVSPTDAYVQNIWIAQGDTVHSEQCITTLNTITKTEAPKQEQAPAQLEKLILKEKVTYVLIGVCIGIVISTIATILNQL